MGDVYYELGFHRWLVEGTVFKTGRIRRFSRVDDPIIDLYVKSGIPITARDVGRFMDRIMLARNKYRVIPRQSPKKAMHANSQDVENAIVNAFPGARAKEVRTQLPAALKALLESKRMSALLYQRFRNESIHGGKVLLNETRFFAESQPYWEGEHSRYFGGYQLVEFPAKFLLQVLRNCLRTFRAHVAAKKKMPPDVHFHVFKGLEHLEFLDYDLLPVVRDLIPK